MAAGTRISRLRPLVALLSLGGVWSVLAEPGPKPAPTAVRLASDVEPADPARVPLRPAAIQAAPTLVDPDQLETARLPPSELGGWSGGIVPPPPGLPADSGRPGIEPRTPSAPALPRYMPFDSALLPPGGPAPIAGELGQYVPLSVWPAAAPPGFYPSATIEPEMLGAGMIPPPLGLPSQPQRTLAKPRLPAAPLLMTHVRVVDEAAQMAPAPPPQLSQVEVIPAPLPPGMPGREQQVTDERPIGALATQIAPVAGILPTNVAATRFTAGASPYEPRPWASFLYSWDAPALCYGPLRYEEINLERYGYSHCECLQPGISAAHFFCSTLALPYSVAARPPWECIYPLGHYRPGSPVPYQCHWPPVDAYGGAAEAGTIAGLILLLP